MTLFHAVLIYGTDGTAGPSYYQMERGEGGKEGGRGGEGGREGGRNAVSQ